MQYKEKEYDNGSRYKGYLNKDGQREGVGILITAKGKKQIGEWHKNKLHQCAKVHYPDGGSYWGEYKDGKKEGYGTGEVANGDRYIGQYM